MKKFITPKDYPYDKFNSSCNGEAVRSEFIGYLERQNESNAKNYLIKFGRDYGSSYWYYTDKEQRDEVFDLILKDLEED